MKGRYGAGRQTGGPKKTPRKTVANPVFRKGGRTEEMPLYGQVVRYTLACSVIRPWG